jgi:pentatricopeptide repeat protein
MTIICRRFADYPSFRGGGSVKHSLQLLDRLAKSVLVVTGTDGSNDDSNDNNIQEEQLQQQPLLSEQSVEPLNDVLTRWKDEYLQSPKDTVHPRQVLEKVDEWKEMVNTCNSIRKGTNNYQQHNRQHSLERLVRPDLNSYMCILQAVADSIDNLDRKNRNKIHFVDTLLERLVEQSKTDFYIQPNVASFATVMNAYVKLNSGNNADINNKNNENYGFSSSAKVEELLNRMQQLNKEGWHNFQPNVVIYNILFNAWAKEGKIEKIEMTLQRMIRLEIPGVSPDPVSYSTLLSAYSKSGKPESVLKADSLLQQMLELYSHGMESAKPNVISFSNVMQCYANVGNGSKAEQWLRRLQDLYHKRGTDNNIHLHHHGHDPDLKPDLALYNTVLLAWAKSGQPQNAEEFLRYMLVMDDEENTTDDFDNNIRPNSQSFNIVLSAWAKIGEAERAESILLEMHQLHVEQNLDTRPTVVSYNTVLDTYAKKATKILNSNEKKNMHHKHNISKTKRKNTRDCEEDEPWNRAEAILNHMLELYRAGDLVIKPTARTWNTGKLIIC